MGENLPLSQIDFAGAFRHEAARTIEYSLGPDASEFGTMVGGPNLLPQVGSFLSSVEFAADWYWVVQQFVSTVRPDTFLFKADWKAGALASVTLYCRFPQPVRQDELTQLFRLWPALVWNGPSTDALSGLFDVPGPRGIGFRCGNNGATHSALYFRVPTPLRHFRRQTLPRLTALCGFDAERYGEIVEATSSLYSGVPVGVIGLDTAPKGGAGTLKLDPSEVPLRVILSWLSEYDTPAGYVQQIAALASNLRATRASYFGLKFNSAGLSGWKIYLAVAPNALAARSPPVNAREPFSAFHLAHY